MKILLLALLPCVSYAADCEKQSAEQRQQEYKLQSNYLQQVPVAQWGEYLEATNALIEERYVQRVEECQYAKDK